MANKEFTLPGLPNDTLTSEIVNERSFKVALQNLGEISDSLAIVLAKTHEQNDSIINELKLLNLRFEEMANTRINENDIGK